MTAAIAVAKGVFKGYTPAGAPPREIHFPIFFPQSRAQNQPSRRTSDDTAGTHLRRSRSLPLPLSLSALCPTVAGAATGSLSLSLSLALYFSLSRSALSRRTSHATAGAANPSSSTIPTALSPSPLSPLFCPDMLGRKRRDRSRTMDELLRQAQTSMLSREPRPTPDAAQSSSMAPPSRPSTSRPSPSTPVDASTSTSSAPPSWLASADSQTGATSTGPSSSRGRGPARGIRTWNSGHPIDVEFDETYHPVGPYARQLICQLGHMVRDPYAFPLTTLDWEAFPVETLDRTWQQIKDNLRTCPELFRPVCMSKCRKMWKDHKNKVKMQYWKPHQDAPDILERVPRGVLPDQWTQLVRYWTSEEAKREAATNARNRAMQGPAHRSGTRHITQVHHELLFEGVPVDRMSVWMRSRDPRHPEVGAIFAQYQSRLKELTEEERSLPSRRDAIFHSVVGRDGHGYTLTYGTGIPRSHIVRSESSGASSSQGLRLRRDEEVKELLLSMKAAIKEEVRAEMRAEMMAEFRAEMAELEARLSQSHGPLASDPPPTTEAPDAGSGHRASHDSVGECSHDPAGSTDPDQV